MPKPVSVPTTDLAIALLIPAARLVVRQRDMDLRDLDANEARELLLDLARHALVVAGTEEIGLIRVDGRLDLAASTVDALAQEVVIRMEGRCSTDIALPEHRLLPVRTIGMRHLHGVV